MKFNQVHASFKLNGTAFNSETLKVEAESLSRSKAEYQKELGEFLLDWLSDSETITAKTSGSTGAPKSIQLKKESMRESAIATGTFFGLNEGEKALLCLPIDYIAGKMMLVRALVLGLEIESIEPKIKLDLKNKTYDFAAMIPSQMEENLAQLEQIKTLIVGGRQIDKSLKKQLRDLNCNVFETYGMTETITHIGVKQLETATNEDSDDFFKTLPNITVSSDRRGCLIIDAPRLSSVKIKTNDIVEINSETEFDWQGRFDNVINSGGIKLFPEQIEAKLQPYLKTPYFITSEEDKRFGERVVLVLESDSNQLDLSVLRYLEKEEKPKKIMAIPKFVRTSSGKVQRKKTVASHKK